MSDSKEYQANILEFDDLKTLIAYQRLEGGKLMVRTIVITGEEAEFEDITLRDANAMGSLMHKVSILESPTDAVVPITYTEAELHGVKRGELRQLCHQYGARNAWISSVKTEDMIPFILLMQKVRS